MENDYNNDQSIDLNLTQDELVSLSIALLEALAAHGYAYRGGEFSKDGAPAPVESLPPTSCAATMIRTFRRVQMGMLGNKNWNNRAIL